MSEPSVGWTFDDLCARFERAWRDGQRPHIEDYLAGHELAQHRRHLRAGWFLPHVIALRAGRHGRPVRRSLTLHPAGCR
jgi:hypothetical protein